MHYGILERCVTVCRVNEQQKCRNRQQPVNVQQISIDFGTADARVNRPADLLRDNEVCELYGCYANRPMTGKRAGETPKQVLCC
jgi:hypothetical protein